MKGWVIPAPAPWANTKHARAALGRIRSAETEAAFPISMSSFCVLATFILSDRHSPHDRSIIDPIIGPRERRFGQKNCRLVWIKPIDIAFGQPCLTGHYLSWPLLGSITNLVVAPLLTIVTS